MYLTEEEKETLLAIAKESIQAALDEKPFLHRGDIDSPALNAKSGAFVTLKINGDLRGCIGYIEAVKPLHKAVEEMALAAAFRDPRFPPLNKTEMKDLEYEISVLSPLAKVDDIEDIEVGRHGLYIVNGFRSGLLLPQVAAEYNWDRETFLAQTCYKAGLHPRAWKDPDTKIFCFSAAIFNSSEK